MEDFILRYIIKLIAIILFICIYKIDLEEFLNYKDIAFGSKLFSESKLFEKYTLNNNVEVKNRLVIAPLTLLASNPDGSISDEEREYLKFRG